MRIAYAHAPPRLYESLISISSFSLERRDGVWETDLDADFSTTSVVVYSVLICTSCFIMMPLLGRSRVELSLGITTEWST